MAIEPITFDKGLNTARSPLLLAEGELVTAVGMSYANEGVIEPRESRQKVSVTQYGTISAIRRSVNNVLLVDGENVRWKWDLDGYCDLYVPPNGDFTLLGTLLGTARPRIADFDDFAFIATKDSRKAFVSGNLYDWDIPAPQNPPSAAAGAAGNPTGTYSLYYTYLIYFPNGRAVETAPSPAGSFCILSSMV